ncbi:LPS assembly lipoprotein LptE [Azonexus hydrophilus]|jgi:LPS-assembly lipoprotein|uniref:LPS-assembly lipoprotein LptE n=1 Tax=Azonexus hydrophilus TaxID=418702 RepID=A0ABZ2XKY3_9RHOO|nr:LPS assembly lipoprotein LptE [Azonexus hydrophilus]MBS4016906.1 hypothetical protein [Dechloromonas sp.]
MPYPLRALFALLLALLVAGCGFQLRGANGSSTLPYRTLHIALPETSEVRIWLERYIQGSSASTRLLTDPKAAEAVFVQLDDNRQKSILSVNAQGRVREYRLQLNYSFRLVNAEGREIVSPVDIVMTRDISFNDSQVLAKDIEENLLWRDMNNDLVNQIMRRLSLIKPKDPSTAAED